MAGWLDTIGSALRYATPGGIGNALYDVGSVYLRGQTPSPSSPSPAPSPAASPSSSGASWGEYAMPGGITSAVGDLWDAFTRTGTPTSSPASAPSIGGGSANFGNPNTLYQPPQQQAQQPTQIQAGYSYPSSRGINNVSTLRDKMGMAMDGGFRPFLPGSVAGTYANQIQSIRNDPLSALRSMVQFQTVPARHNAIGNIESTRLASDAATQQAQINADAQIQLQQLQNQIEQQRVANEAAKIANQNSLGQGLLNNAYGDNGILDNLISALTSNIQGVGAVNPIQGYYNTAGPQSTVFARQLGGMA